MPDFTSTISTHENGPLGTQCLLCCYRYRREAISSYLCSNSRMDRRTPEVDAFCCRVAKNVNSLLFQKSWINFSLTWGGVWISLSTSKEEGNSPVKTLSQKDSDYIFHFAITIFHLPCSTTAFVPWKKPKCHLCQPVHLSQLVTSWFSDRIFNRMLSPLCLLWAD